MSRDSISVLDYKKKIADWLKKNYFLPGEIDWDKEEARKMAIKGITMLNIDQFIM